MICPECNSYHQEATTDGRCITCIKAQARRIGQPGPA